MAKKGRGWIEGGRISPPELCGEWLFFYFSNGGDVVVVVGGGCAAVPLSLDGVNYTERQMVSITQGGTAAA